MSGFVDESRQKPELYGSIVGEVRREWLRCSFCMRSHAEVEKVW